MAAASLHTWLRAQLAFFASNQHERDQRANNLSLGYQRKRSGLTDEIFIVRRWLCLNAPGRNVVPALANDWRGGVVTILNGRGFLTYKLIEVDEKPTNRFAVGYFMEGSTKTQGGQILPSAGWIDCKEGYYEFWNEVDPANYTSSEEIMGALNTMVREFCGGHSIDYRDSPYYKKGGNAFYL